MDTEMEASGRMNQKPLVLSLFPGIDLFGIGFERAGFCVVRGPDLLWGQSIVGWHAPAGHFEGVIGGPPCPDFSSARRGAPIFDGDGARMLGEFCRVIEESQTEWFVMENVSRVPDVTCQGYRIQRIDLNARECGSNQSRLRHFQFGSRHEDVITVTRQAVDSSAQSQRCCLATEGRRPVKYRRNFADFCELQGLPRDFSLPSLNQAGRYRAVGNGVPVQMAEAIAQAVTRRRPWSDVRLCQCGCGRELTGGQVLATAACRKRQQRRRDAAAVSDDRGVTPQQLAI